MGRRKEEVLAEFSEVMGQKLREGGFQYGDAWFVQLKSEFLGLGGSTEELRRTEDATIAKFYQLRKPSSTPQVSALA